MKSVFIVNPVAGGRDISNALAQTLAQAVSRMDLGQDTYAITRTTHAGHAKKLAEEYARTGEPVRLFAVGGDGTFNEVISGAYPYKNAAVGCIPYGSGNDFLRNFGTKEEFLDLAGQLTGGELDIDLMQTEYGVGAAICSAGLDAQIAHGIPKFRRLPLCGGEMAYRLSILEQLMGPLGRRLTLTLDGVPFTQDCLMTAICNGGYYGGGFHAAPECRMDDGLLDVMVVRKASLLRIARMLPLYQKGKHIQAGQVIPKLRKHVEFHRCRSVALTLADNPEKPIIITVDGECRPAPGLTVKLLPLAGRIVLPAKVFARHRAAVLRG